MTNNKKLTHAFFAQEIINDIDILCQHYKDEMEFLVKLDDVAILSCKFVNVADWTSGDTDMKIEVGYQPLPNNSFSMNGFRNFLKGILFWKHYSSTLRSVFDYIT